MAYEKQYFRDGEILKAEQLNHIEDGIVALEETGGGSGQPGEAGVGIESIEQTTTSEEPKGVNVITLTLTDGTVKEFTVRNGSGVDGGLSIIPMTKAEYEALTEEEKLRDDVIYEITDQTGGVKFGSADISGIGDGTVTGAIGSLNSSLEISQTQKASSYGTVNVLRYGQVVTLSGNLSGIPTGSWTTIAEGLPKPIDALFFCGIDSSAWNEVTYYLRADGVLQYFGRNEHPATSLCFTYITID